VEGGDRIKGRFAPFSMSSYDASWVQRLTSLPVLLVDVVFCVEGGIHPAALIPDPWLSGYGASIRPSAMTSHHAGSRAVGLDPTQSRRGWSTCLAFVVTHRWEGAEAIGAMLHARDQANSGVRARSGEKAGTARQLQPW